MQRWGLGVLALCLAGTATAGEPAEADQAIEADASNDNAVTFRFPEPMQTLGMQEGTPVARFSPALPVKACNWTNDTALTCTFVRDLPNATPFTATLPPGLRTVSGKPLPTAPIKFETDRPSLWVSSRWENNRLVFTISAREDSLPESSIAAALKMTVDGKPVPIELRKAKQADAWHLDAPDATTESTLELSIVPGLASTEGPLRGDQDEVVMRAIIGEPFQVRGAVCAGGGAPVIARVNDGRIDLAGCVPSEQVRVLFSRRLDKTALNAWYATWPPGVRRLAERVEDSYRYGAYGKKDPPQRAPGMSVSFAVDAMRAQQSLAIPALPDDIGGTQLAPVELHVATTAPRPSFTAPFAHALLERGADPGLRSINSPPVKLETFAFGREVKRESTRSPQSPESGTPLQLDGVRRALDEGGYATVATHHEGQEVARLGRMEVAAPDFDVHARVGQRSVLAWVNAWDGDAPIAGAKATLLFDDGNQPRAVADATTDAQGVVLLRLPLAFRLPEKKNNADYQTHWFVRVERGRGRAAQRAILPIDAARWRGGLGTDPDVKLWGVADRPLYRAGDLVHWTLWMRTDDGRRYVAPGAAQTRTLRLAPQYGRSMLASWEATFDEHGRATGETRIPIHARDGEYCIAVKDEGEAACFHVGTFRPQDLWVRASSKRDGFRPGDTLAIDVATGFYSGGSAAGIALEKVEAFLVESTPAHVWKQWREYAFVDESGSGEEIEFDDITAKTDAKGHASLKLPIDARFDALDVSFGLLRTTVEAKPQDRESTTSNTVEVYYAKHARYVGLKVDLDPWDATSPVRMAGVVIDAEGREIPGQRIDVDVAFSGDDEGDDEDEEENQTPLRTCTLTSGATVDCTFPRKRSGVYVIGARSADAAPAIVSRDLWVSGSWGGAGDDESEPLEIKQLGEGKTTAGKPLRLEIHAPNAPTRALLSVSRGADVIDHRVLTLASKTQVVEIPTATDWPDGVMVQVAVRRLDAPPAAVALPAGFRRPIAVDNDSIGVSLEFPAVTPPVSVAFERTQAAPAETVRLVLRNDSDKARGVTLAVTDDALRALGAKWLEAMDPGRALFRHGPYAYGSDAGFAQWNQAPLRWLLARNAKNKSCLNAPLDECIVTVVGNGAIDPIDVTSVESTTIFTAEQIAQLPTPRDVTRVALLAPGTVRPSELSSMQVVGTQMQAAAAPPQQTLLGRSVERSRRNDDPAGPFRPDRTPQAEYGASLARIRTQFADTTLWRSDIVLAPGESKTLDLVVPDNLTRWRAVAWSHDDADDFAMAEATLEAGLPVEARLQTPVRIYPGDSARLALNVRQTADHASKAEARISLVQGTLESQKAATLRLPANGQGSFGLTIAPNTIGTVLVTGAAATPDGRDAVAAPIDIDSTSILATRTQAGWVAATPLSLELPKLPHGAHDAHVDVSVWRGASALIEGWTEDMRVYPHRCWEQILSRAVAAALAIERKDPSWPEAKAVVQEALDNAGAFQTDNGSMRYFNGGASFSSADASGYVPLTAYTVDALALLRSLGYAVDPEIEARARTFLADGSWDAKAEPGKGNERAIAASIVDLDAAKQAKVATDFDSLALPAQVAAARALARKNAPDAARAFTALLDRAPQRGEARSLQRDTRWDRWMSSPMREQCELIRLLEDYPRFAPEGARRSLIAGLADLYAGGVGDIDTQSAAACLRALRTDANAGAAQRIVVDATVGAQTGRLAVAAGERRAGQRFAMPAGGEVTIAPVERPDAPVAFLARVAYQEDARHAQASAMGFSISRHYDVKRGTQWVPLNGGALRDDDWVRITLTIDNADARYFVAVTDDLPGGLRPVDMELAGVSGAAGDQESRYNGYFDEQKLDARQPKFYAQRLPAGNHVIRYYARVGNAGDYLAAPAVVELMYGEASRARTAADRIRIAEPKNPPAP